MKAFTLEIVKVKGDANWAIKAVVDNLFWHPRYRGYYYKADAIRGMETWIDCDSGYFRDREFKHNFFSAEEVGIEEIK